MIEITITLEWWEPDSGATLAGTHEGKISVSAEDDLDAVNAAVTAYAEKHATDTGYSPDDQSSEWDYSDADRAKSLEAMSLRQLFEWVDKFVG